MKCFEYIRAKYDGTLDQVNALGSIGWEICAYEPTWKHLILKREVPEHLQFKNREYYRTKFTTE